MAYVKGFWVYGLVDPRDGNLRYIGQTQRGMKRIHQHFAPYNIENERTRKSSWIKGLRKVGLKPQVVWIEELQTADALYDAERFWIASIRATGAILYNSADGGLSASLGATWSAESRAKASQSAKRKFAQPGALERLRQSLKGRKLSPEAIKKSADSRRGLKMSDSAKEKLRIANTGRVHSEEWNKKNGDARRGIKQRPETIERRRLANTGKTHRKRTVEECRASSSQKGGRPFEDQNGNVYYTLSEAATALGLDFRLIHKVLKGERKHTKGHGFSYVKESIDVNG